MTEPNRLRRVRDTITSETAKLPPHSAQGHHAGGLARHYRDDTAAVDLTGTDTTVSRYGGPGDEPTEQVRTMQSDPAATPAAWTPPTPRAPKPDPSQGAKSGGPVDGPALALSEGRTRDALSMVNEHLRTMHTGQTTRPAG